MVVSDREAKQRERLHFMSVAQAMLSEVFEELAAYLPEYEAARGSHLVEVASQEWCPWHWLAEERPIAGLEVTPESTRLVRTLVAWQRKWNLTDDWTAPYLLELLLAWWQVSKGDWGDVKLHEMVPCFFGPDPMIWRSSPEECILRVTKLPDPPEYDPRYGTRVSYQMRVDEYTREVEGLYKQLGFRTKTNRVQDARPYQWLALYQCKNLFSKEICTRLDLTESYDDVYKKLSRAAKRIGLTLR